MPSNPRSVRAEIPAPPANRLCCGHAPELAIPLLSLSLAAPLAAQPPSVQNPLTFVQAGQWPQARAVAALTGDPLADKLIVYYQMLAPHAASAADIASFIRQNPEWPLPGLLERRRQEAIAAETDNVTVAALCTERQPAIPTPARGAALLRCADALADLGRAREAGAIAREAWVSAISDLATEAAFLRRFPGLISPADQWARFQRLAWDDPAARNGRSPTSTRRARHRRRRACR